LSGAGHWPVAFMLGTAFALAGAACWLLLDPDRRV